MSDDYQTLKSSDGTDKDVQESQAPLALSDGFLSITIARDRQSLIKKPDSLLRSPSQPTATKMIEF